VEARPKRQTYINTGMIVHTHTLTYRDNIFAIMGLFEGTGGDGRGQENDRVNDIEIHCICVGRCYNDMH
jgi:hypothetical protein